VLLAWGREKVGVALEDLQFTVGQGRAHAYARQRPIAEIATDVVVRRPRSSEPIRQQP
jgi:hypothetical protein